MKRLFSTLCLTALIAPVPTFAQDAAKDWTLSGSTTFATDYVFRGFSQTNEHIAVQPSLTLAHKSGFSASLWGSNLNFNDGNEASAEVDGTLSYTVNGITLGGIYYAYPGADRDLDYDYVEAFAGYTFNAADLADITAQIFYSPDFFAGSGDAVYTTAAISVPVKPVSGLNIVGSAGHQWIKDEVKFGAPDYSDWSAGLSYTWDKVNFSAKYYDTDIGRDNCSGLCDSRVVAAVSVSF